MTKKVYNSLMVNAKDYIMIVVGLILYAVGFCVFILPHHIVIIMTVGPHTSTTS